MSPGAIDLKVVQDRLLAVRAYVQRLRSLPAGNREEFMADTRNADTAESLLRRSLEALLDIARHLLARGHGRGALEYAQVAQLSREHGIVGSADLADRFEKMAKFRNRLTHFYDEVTPDEIYALVSNRLGDIELVAAELERAAGRLAASNGER